MNTLKDNLLISIIMPAYNVEKYIAQSIKSVIAQTYNNWELIIIDDGSTDQTATIVKQFACDNNKIKYLYQENAKQAVARNNGINSAEGTILAFLDSDDLWLPNKLEQTLAVFDLDKYDLVFTNSYISNAEDLNVNCTSFKDLHVSSSSYFGKDALQLFISGNRIPILTVLVKKSAVQDVGLFDKECVPAEDYDLWVRLLKKGYTFFSIQENTAIYRIHQNSSTAIDRLAASAVVKSITKNFTPTELKDLKVQLSLKNWIINWIRTSLDKNNMFLLNEYLILFNIKSRIISMLIFNHKFFKINILKRILILTIFISYLPEKIKKKLFSFNNNIAKI